VRQSRTQGKLSLERIALLEALGVAWEVRDTVWEKMFEALVAFNQKKGSGREGCTYLDPGPCLPLGGHCHLTQGMPRLA
jgi:hypothetical protein